ncbi:MAG: ROK family protein [Clostridiales bacterium]|nr:ROK family protein [Clostridiales bacterium]
MKKITQTTIRTQNIKTIFDIISNRGMIARSEIAKLSNLSLMTVSNIIDHLDRFDLILHESKEETSMVGRKAELLSIKKDTKKLIVLDLTTLNFSFVALNLDLTLHHNFNDWKYDVKYSYLNNLRSFLSVVNEYIDTEYVDQEIIGIGVSVPGPYDATSDIVITKRIQALMEIPLKATIKSVVLNNKLEDRDQVADCDIFIDEDVKFASLANIVMVPEYKSKTVFYMYIGEGVGGAISVNGKVLRGASSFAGDIGQLLINENTNFEERISMKAFSRKMLRNAIAIENLDTIESVDTIDNKAPIDNDDSMDLLRAFQANQPDKFNELFEKQCNCIALALYNVIWFIDPHAIIIECEYAELKSQDFIEHLNIKLSRMLPERHVIPELFLSNPSIKNANIGAGITLRNRWLESIS